MKKIAIIIVLCAAMAMTNKIYPQVTASVRVTVVPPVLPVYVQPACPVEGYLWEPGYWGWDPVAVDYYWVPGVWVAPPSAGLLWTPGYWGYVNGVYLWNAGYWGPQIGFYGGVCYGFGYWGTGFYGGVWEGGRFRYNTAVMRVNTTVVYNTYVNRTVVRSNGSRVSFNGRGGVQAQPTAAERTAMSERHIPATSAQQSHQLAAMKDKSQHYSANKGSPSTAAMNKVNGQRYSNEGHVANTATVNTHTATNTAAHASHTPQATSHTGGTALYNATAAPHQANSTQQQHNATAQQRSHMAAQQHHAVAQHQVQAQHTNSTAQQHNYTPKQQHYNPATNQTHASRLQQQHAPMQRHSSPALQQHSAAPRGNIGGGASRGGGAPNERH